MRRIKIEDYKTGFTLEEKNNTLNFDFFYPRTNKIKYLEVGLSDVRASDNIRISFDFERNGWKIEQSYIIEKEVDDYIDCTTSIWEEVGFFLAYNLETKSIKII